MITAGIDVGAKFIKIVILKDGRVLGRGKALVGFDISKSAANLFTAVLKDAGLSRNKIEKIGATGMGRKAILHKPPIKADEGISVVLADAAGIFHLMPTVKTIIDVGAEKARAIEVGPEGTIKDFAINEKCAAGVGTLIEAMARALEVKVEDMGPLSLKSKRAININAQCAVFAESEIVGLIHSKVAKEDISKAIHEAIAARIAGMVHRVRMKKEIALIGGVALNPGFLPLLERELEQKIIVPEFPEYVTALGAALIAAKTEEKKEVQKEIEKVRKKVSKMTEISSLKKAKRKKKKTKEYWKWPEYRYTMPRKDWQKAKIITAGVDVGSVGSKAVIMLDGRLYTYAVIRTGGISEGTAMKVLNWALEETDLKIENIHYIVGTGYGRPNISFAKRKITEIACHARGAHYIYGPTVRTILDIGGQDCKAIRCDERGKVVTFLMNDKCAAGTGRGFEIFADLIGVPIQDLGEVSLSVDQEPRPVSNTCVIFAKAESLALLRQGWPKEKVAASYHTAMANRIFGLLSRVGLEKDFVITGGCAKNIGIVKRLERLTNLKPLSPKFDPILAGAIGAALFAKALREKELGLR